MSPDASGLPRMQFRSRSYGWAREWYQLPLLWPRCASPEPWWSMVFSCGGCRGSVCGYALASWPRIRELSRPALAFMAFPAGNAISIQGTTILIGFLLNPVAVATFNPMRTLSRFAFRSSIRSRMRRGRSFPPPLGGRGTGSWPGNCTACAVRRLSGLQFLPRWVLP